QAAALAAVGHQVVCVDIDPRKIPQLQRGVPTIHDPGLAERHERNLAEGRLGFTTQAPDAALHANIFFFAFAPLPTEDDDADLGHVLDVAREIARLMERDKTLIIKSTVPVGTADRVLAVARETLAELGKGMLNVSIVSNPEFLREGSAVNDCIRPDRIVAG